MTARQRRQRRCVGIDVTSSSSLLRRRRCGEGWARKQAVGGDDVMLRWAAKRAIVDVRVSTGERNEFANAGVESLQFCKRGDAVMLQDGWISSCKRAVDDRIARSSMTQTSWVCEGVLQKGRLRSAWLRKGLAKHQQTSPWLYRVAQNCVDPQTLKKGSQ